MRWQAIENSFEKRTKRGKALCTVPHEGAMMIEVSAMAKPAGGVLGSEGSGVGG
jgi:hypothetical protein